MSEGRTESRIEEDEIIQEGRLTKPAEVTVDTDDLWRAPGQQLSLVGLLLPALAALLIVGGALMIAVLSSASFATRLASLVDHPPANAAFWVLAGAVVIAAGMILFFVAYAYFRRARSEFRAVVEKYRIEGVATMQAVQRLSSGSPRR